MSIPDAAIEAAAEAMYRDAPFTKWGDLDDVIAEGYRADARAAIEAAMPAIREHIAQEIEAEMADVLEQDGDAVTAIWIVRGGAE